MSTEMNSSMIKRLFPFPCMIISALILSACGGGGGGGGHGDGSPEEPPVMAFASGSITGVTRDSFIVNGVRYLDAKAFIGDEEGNRRSSGDLALGMVVDIISTPITRDSEKRPQARAESIIYRSEITGPIDYYAAGKAIHMHGQVIRLTPTTVFDESFRDDFPRKKDIVEVYGYHESDGSYVATRVNRMLEKPSFYKLHGSVSQIDFATRTLKLGSRVIDFSEAGGLPGNVAKGNYLRINVHTRLNTLDQMVAISAYNSGPSAINIPEETDTRIEGAVTYFHNALSFSVSGIPVNIAATTPVPDGLARGSRVKVGGHFAGNILAADTVALHDDEDVNAFTLEGDIWLHDAASKTFDIYGTLVSYAGNINYTHGYEENLADNVRVAVTGFLSRDGTTVRAVWIRFR